MAAPRESRPPGRPSYVVDPNGRPTAVVIDLVTWKSILAHLEGLEDSALFDVAEADLEALARGHRPPGWVAWSEFEAELDQPE